MSLISPAVLARKRTLTLRPTVSEYILLDIKTTIHQTELIREEWFKEGKLIKITQHDFLVALERIDEDQKLARLMQLSVRVTASELQYTNSAIART